MKEKNKKRFYGFLPIIALAFMLLLWAVVAKTVGKEYLLPSIGSTVKEFFGLFAELKFYRALLRTLLRTLGAFICSFALAFVFAVSSKKNKIIDGLISPVIGVLRALPTVAVVLILLVWTNSEVAPVVVTMLVVMPTEYTQIKNAFDGVDKTVTEAGMVDGANGRGIFFKIELPLILPAVFRSVGSGFSLNFKLMVAAEVLSATSYSIGGLLNGASYNFETAQMIALVLVSVICGLAVEVLFNALAKKTENDF